MIPVLSNQNASFIVADSAGLYRLNSEGNVIWRFDAEAFIDVSQLENGNIVALNDRSELIFYSENGDRHHKITLTDKTNHFQIIKWPINENILIESNGDIKIIDFKGCKLFEYRIENFSSYHAPQGLEIYFEKGQSPYLVILLHGRSSLGLSQLNIFSPNGELVYKETLHSTTGICVNSNSIEEGEKLLVGNNQSGIIEYKFQKQRTLGSNLD